VEQLDLVAVVGNATGADNVVESAIRETIREVFGAQSPEFTDHQHIDIWAGAYYMNMHPNDVLGKKPRSPGWRCIGAIQLLRSTKSSSANL